MKLPSFGFNVGVIILLNVDCSNNSANYFSLGVGHIFIEHLLSLGKKANVAIQIGEHVKWKDLNGRYLETVGK